MEELHKDISSEETTQKQTTGRRKFLKKVAATAGAMGASILLPAKWAKPLVEVITLPAHAETSAPSPSPSPSPPPDPSPSPSPSPPPDPSPSPPPGALTISNLVVEGSTTVLEAASKKAESLKGTFNFLDEDCEVSYKATLQYTLDTGGELNFTSGSTLSSIPAATTGSNCIGEITFPFTVNALANELNISLGVNSRESNWLTATRKSEK